jgi:hypothetical protein
MKIKTIMMSLALSLSTMAVFASASPSDQKAPLPFSNLTKNLQHSVIVSKPETSVCTVTVKYGRISSTITISCECTTKEACASAYKLATLLL